MILSGIQPAASTQHTVLIKSTATTLSEIKLNRVNKVAQAKETPSPSPDVTYPFQSDLISPGLG